MNKDEEVWETIKRLHNQRKLETNGVCEECSKSVGLDKLIWLPFGSIMWVCKDCQINYNKERDEYRRQLEEMNQWYKENGYEI